MNDLISRQAAIDAIEHRLAEPEYQHTGEDWYVGMNCAESELYDLPSAQPEQRWTPCSERPPEEIGTYMTTIDYGRAGLAVGQRFYCGKYLGWEDECVIAWMPLPEPYKGGEQDE